MFLNYTFQKHAVISKRISDSQLIQGDAFTTGSQDSKQNRIDNFLNLHQE